MTIGCFWPGPMLDWHPSLMGRVSLVSLQAKVSGSLGVMEDGILSPSVLPAAAGLLKSFFK